MLNADLSHDWADLDSDFETEDFVEVLDKERSYENCVENKL